MIKGERFQRVYSKLYTDSKEKISASFYELKGGEKKLIEDPTDWASAAFTGKILFRITGVFSTKKNKDYYIIREESTSTQEGRRTRANRHDRK